LWIPVLIVVLVPILALVLTLIAFRSRSGGLSELEARIKTKGEPLTVTDLDAFYASVPDEENGALLLIEAWAREDPLFWDAFRRGAFSLPPRRDTAVDPIVPFLGRDARDFSRTNSLSEAARAAAEDFLATHRERIDLVRAAIRKEHFRFPLQFSNTLDMLMPHLSALMENVRTFRLESLLAIERGDVDGAIGALEGAVQCADVLAREPVLMSQLARMGSYAQILSSLEILLSRRALSDAELKRADALLEKMSTAGALRIALLGERVMNLSIFERMPQSVRNEQGNAQGWHLAMGLITVTGIKAADRRLMLETMEQAVALAGRQDPGMPAEFQNLIDNAMEEASRFPPRFFRRCCCLCGGMLRCGFSLPKRECGRPGRQLPWNATDGRTRNRCLQR